MPTFTRGEIEKLILVLPPGLDNCSWDEAKALKFKMNLDNVLVLIQN